MKRTLTILISLLLLVLLAACAELEQPSLEDSFDTQAVLSPYYAIEALMDEVVALDLPVNVEQPLLAILGNAQRSVDRGNTQAALGQLGSFRNMVEAQSGKKIPEVEALALVASGEWVMGMIGEPCVLEGGVLTQADVEVLRGCTSVDGSLQIGPTDSVSNDIVDLTPLGALKEVTGNLNITKNGALTSLQGLGDLSKARALSIQDNPALTSIEGLKDLTTLDYLLLNYNVSLTSLKGLEGLTSLLEVELVGNEALTSCEGLNNLTTVERYLSISDAPSLTSLEGLNSLTSVAVLGVQNTPALTSLEALQNLTTIAWPWGPGSLYIGNADSLTSLAGLNSVTTAGAVYIQRNALLASITDLGSLSTVLEWSTVSDNPMLDCSLTPQPPFLPVDVSEGNLVDCPTGFTDWLTWSGYQAEFERQAANRRYPVVVEGRNNNGVSEYRGYFVDFPPGPFSFWSHHSWLTPAFEQRHAELVNAGYVRIHHQWFTDAQGNVRNQGTWVRR